ncbi:hypothetical protein NEMIN01_1533 [Nematocida minor]|uniref:uncharacterized protein n=1 Tax=Nematocida minor TaxID=1912983 RepID=UPI00221E8BD0|nr:uncharacterized protein NEMIN01_1533 [Nematocida minor]KAI5191507.1 hypothetical protein NEMIN01_1533 [Nematocida minor]
MKLNNVLCIIMLLALFITECRAGSDDSNEADSIAGPSKGRKRKINETEDCMDAYNSQQSPENEEQNVDDDLSETEIEKRYKVPAKDLLFSLWTEKRLDNKRRKAYKKFHTTEKHPRLLDMQRKMIDTNRKDYQDKLKKSIDEYFDISDKIKDHMFWYYIASKNTITDQRHRTFFGLKWLFKNGEVDYMKKIESFEGYYPDVSDDMIDYIEKYQPMRSPKGNPITTWKETFGDIYMRERFYIEHFMPSEQEAISKLEEKYRALACAVQMIFMLPEVCQDFSKINEKFIEKTHTLNTELISDVSKKVLLALHKLLKLHMFGNKDVNAYNELYEIFESERKEKKLLELTETGLYKEMYTIIGDFYEKAAVVYEKNHVLKGKLIITNQRYKVCRKTVKLNPQKEGSYESVKSPEYEPAKNEWKVSSNTHMHYHIYYVDNLAGCTRMLCMPIHEEGRKKYYMHTIEDMIEHIEKLYEIKEKTEKVHPFKVEKKTRKWEYIKESDRGQTMETLLEYDLVFYHVKESIEILDFIDEKNRNTVAEPIEEEYIEVVELSSEKDVKNAEFTFAEFSPKTPHGENTTCIPLLLTPLMQHAVALGPFIKKEDADHTVIKSVETIDQKPNVYVYNEEKYGGKNFSDMYNYYSNMYIQQDEEKKKNIDCYIMNCKTEKKDSIIEAVWYVRMSDSVDAYTHCILDESLKKNTREFDRFIGILESREYNKDSDFQSFWLSKDSIKDSKPENKTKTIWNWNVFIKNLGKKPKTEKEILSGIKDTDIRIKELKAKITELENTKSEFKEKEFQRKRNSLVTMMGISTKKKTAFSREVSRKPDMQAEFIVFRNSNDSKSNLGAHNELLDVIITFYGFKNLKKVNKVSSDLADPVE